MSDPFPSGPPSASPGVPAGTLPGSDAPPPLLMVAAVLLCAVAALVTQGWVRVFFFAGGTLQAAAVLAITIRQHLLDRRAATTGFTRRRYRHIPANGPTGNDFIVLDDQPGPQPWSGTVIQVRQRQPWLAAGDGGAVLVSQPNPGEWVLAPLDSGRRCHATTVTRPGRAEAARTWVRSNV